MRIFKFFLLFIFVSSINKQPILFVGDSLTTYTGGWQYDVAKGINCKFDNISVGGKRILWMEKTLRSHLNSNKNYSKIFIYGGCNDAYSYVNLDSSICSLQRMINICNSYNIDVVIVVGYDPNLVNINTSYSDLDTKRARDRYCRLQSLMLNLKNCKIIPVNKSIVRSDSDDGIHLRLSGNKKLSKWVLDNLN